MPDPQNRRKHNPRNLGLVVDALQQVGAARSIVIDENDVILAGNGVSEAAAEAGITKVRVIEADGQEIIAVRRSGLSEEQKRALAMYDNRSGELAEWDAEQLQADLDAGLSLEPWFSDQEVAAIVKPAGKAGLTDPDTVPPERLTSIVTGDLFELARHRLLCGDSTSADALASLMGSKTADVCLTDPPYGIGLEYQGFIDSKEAVADLASKWLPLARQAAAVVVFSPGVTRQWLYPEPDWVLCWFYGGGQLRSPWGFNCWQPFLAYGKDPSLAAGRGCRPDAVDMNTPANAAEIAHPCPKPVALWEWLLQRLTFEPDALVLDMFCGGGTGIIAAEQLTRRCYAIERAPTYCQVTIDRWEAFTGQRAHKIGEVTGA